MSDRSSRSRATFIVVQVVWGMTLLIAPGVVLQVLGGANEDRTPERVMRVLGVRHVLQATGEYVFGDAALRLGVRIDELHALSGFGFACANARWRRAALADAAITSGFAACGLIEMRSVTPVVPR
jgi:hypothetical protein